MSEVFFVKNEENEFIIHKIFLTPEHRKRNYTNLIQILSNYFSITKTPLAPSYLYKKQEWDFLFTLQKFIPGTPWGTRSLKEGKIYDEFFIKNLENYFSELLSFLATLHQAPVEGSGAICGFQNNCLMGEERNWKDFLKKNSKEWLQKVEIPEMFHANIQNLINSIPDTLKLSLVHGDCINPSNILTKNESIVSVIDWEWSLIGDPAWEFADIWWENMIERYGLYVYFQKRGILSTKEQNDFLERVKKYRILWLLWGTALHARDKDKELFSLLRSLLFSRIQTLT